MEVNPIQWVTDPTEKESFQSTGILVPVDRGSLGTTYKFLRSYGGLPTIQKIFMYVSIPS